MKKLKQILKNINWSYWLKAVAVFAFILSPVVVPRIAGAQLINQIANECPADTGVRCTEGSLAQIFKLIISWALAIAFIAAVIVLIYGGFLYITSAGNQDSASKGKTAIVNALIGIVVIVMSYIIVQIVYRFVSGQSA